MGCASLWLLREAQSLWTRWLLVGSRQPQSVCFAPFSGACLTSQSFAELNLLTRFANSCRYFFFCLMAVLDIIPSASPSTGLHGPIAVVTSIAQKLKRCGIIWCYRTVILCWCRLHDLLYSYKHTHLLVCCCSWAVHLTAISPTKLVEH